ncbi:LuxR C-terminal-related transcriptional regulator [Actinoallomurus purpureus]|uniref:helix-turn-helix transcriptional regulator n=1 Tax=Actinoallomurus purpureus TaxID=478114 RepID=UPI0020935E3B|nr:LuxR C-terminal-related transcriptional regulator [Actinoallomurus purpureus]MCO6010767.1 LuxR C-terminal-related transcriptional regulator [Actinoallomurus purpureus]
MIGTRGDLESGEVVGELEAARSAFERRAWLDAWSGFDKARESEPLSADDQHTLAEAAWRVGEIDESLAAFTDAYRLYQREGRPRPAAMTAMLLAVHHLEWGDGTIGSGWMRRAHRLLRDEADCAEQGYPIYFDIASALACGRHDEAADHARRMQNIGRRYGDARLLAAGLLGEGRALVGLGRGGDGLPLLDEAMLTAFSDGLHPIWSGALFCNLMDVCHELGDLTRAAEWARTATRWSDVVPATVPYRGAWRVHRARVLRMRGAWGPAGRVAERAAEDRAYVRVGVLAEALYEAGEVRRLRGDLTAAEDFFRRAHQLGRDPQPGLALLRLDQGRTDAAAASVRAALVAEAGNTLARARLHPAQVEIALATGDLATARASAAELDATAATYGSSGLRAEAAQALGAVLLADGKADDALAVLRTARRIWQELDAPYAVARTRLLLAEAYRALGDEDAAHLEWEAACDRLRDLGAPPRDPRRAAAPPRDGRPADGRTSLPDGLTEREAEVLRHVAGGDSNRKVANALRLSEKTVARHLSNIFTKLGLSSRTAAAAYAFEHGLAAPPRG